MENLSQLSQYSQLFFHEYLKKRIKKVAAMIIGKKSVLRLKWLFLFKTGESLHFDNTHNNSLLIKIPYPCEYKTVLYQNLKERNQSYNQGCQIFMYLGIRRYIFKFLVLYSRSPYDKGRLLFPRMYCK